MAQQLQDLAGGNAKRRVASFAGAPLPPNALIKSIHIVRVAFAAENHSAESEGIDPSQGERYGVWKCGRGSTRPRNRRAGFVVPKLSGRGFDDHTTVDDHTNVDDRSPASH
jgi:hypothetical protein